MTEKAKQKLKEMLEDSHTLSVHGWRLEAVSEDEYGLLLDTETEGDQVVICGQTKVLLVDAETARRLDGTVVDVEDTEEGQRFMLLRKHHI